MRGAKSIKPYERVMAPTTSVIPNRADDEGPHIKEIDHTNVACVTLSV